MNRRDENAEAAPASTIGEDALGDGLLHRWRGFDARPAVVEADAGTVVTYRELAGGVAAVAARRSALPPGTTVALCGFNGIAWLQFLFGAITAGHRVATVNPTGTPAEIAQQLRRCGAGHLVADPAVVARLDGGLGPDVTVETLEPPAPTGGLTHPVVPAAGDDVVALMTSSGTTGTPKTAQLLRRAFEVSARQMARAWDLRPDDVVLGVLPFSHAAGLTNAVTALTAGVPLVTLPRFEPAAFLGALADHRVSTALLAPPIVRLLGMHPAVDDHDLSALRVVASAGAPLPASVQTACEQRLGVIVCNAYGMTEVGWMAMGTVARPGVPGSVGRVLPDVELRVVDPDTGTDVDDGAVGELWARGPTVTPGYLDDPDATAALLTDDGWARTGDLGYRDDTGTVRLVDRLKDLIKYKGYQVSPAELEQLLLSRDDVADVAVAGYPDPDAGEIPRAYVVARGDVDPDELMAWVAERVSPYKRVRDVAFVDEIPRLPAGKILRRLLRSPS